MNKFLLSMFAVLGLAANVAKADVFWGQDSEGWLYGTTNPWTGAGLLISPDGTRYEFPHIRVIMYRDHDVALVRLLDRHEEYILRYDVNLDRGVDNNDIDGFVDQLMSGLPGDNTFIYTAADIDPFVDQIVN